MPLLGLNNCQPILHEYKRTVHCYSTDKPINKFAIGYMINPSLNFKEVFRIQVEKYLSISFSARTMKTIEDSMRKNNTCVMALIIIHYNNGEIPKKVYRGLSCVVFYLI